MNILHISPYLPSLETNHAGGVCMGRQIETLRTWNEVYVLTFIASDFDQVLANKLKKDARYHFVKLYKWSKALHILQQDLHFDFQHCLFGVCGVIV